MTRFIFCINSGRSGSEYLCKLLGTAANVAAFHEPHPDGAGRRITRYPVSHPSPLDWLLYLPMYAYKYRKILAIRRTVRGLPPDHVYAETNHMFILAFQDVVMNHLRPVDVVLLRRHLAATVKSFVELGYFLPDCPFTRYWFTSPNSPSAAVPALAPDDDLDQFDRIIAYLIDVEARAQRFIARYPDTRVVEFRLMELNQLDRVRALFAALNLVETPATVEFVGRVVNDKPEHKQRVAHPVSIEHCEERVRLYLEKCARKGISLPELPHLTPWEPAARTS